MSIYSDDPTEEARLMAIRDTPSDRVRMMALSRDEAEIGRRMIMFDDIELQWIDEDRRFSRTYPVLSPSQYMAMIHTLAAQLRAARKGSK